MIGLVYMCVLGFIQWAFLERDESRPANGNFWIDDDGRRTGEVFACFKFVSLQNRYHV